MSNIKDVNLFGAGIGETEGQEGEKNEENNKNGDDDLKQDPGFFERVLGSLEISLELKGLEVELKLEKSSRQGPSFKIKIPEISLMKHK